MCKHMYICKYIYTKLHLYPYAYTSVLIYTYTHMLRCETFAFRVSHYRETRSAMLQVNEYPVHSHQIRELEGTHEVRSFVTNPACGGYPLHRIRRFTVGHALGSVAYVGPMDHQKAFDEFYQRQLVLTADAYLIASPEAQLAELEEVGALKKRRLTHSMLSKEDGVALCFPYTITPCTSSRLSLFKEIAKEAGMGDNWVADLKDHPKSINVAPKSIMPTILRHSLLYSEGRKSRILADELLTAMGCDMYNEDQASSLPTVLRNFSPSMKTKLCGNSVHGPLFTLWVLWVLSYTARVPQPNPDLDLNCHIETETESDDLDSSSGTWLD